MSASMHITSLNLPKMIWIWHPHKVGTCYITTTSQSITINDFLPFEDRSTEIIVLTIIES